MSVRLAALALVVVLMSIVAPRARAQRSAPPALYVLEDGSNFEWGCYGMCLCAVRQSPLKGTFRLRHSSPDPLFDHYEVSDVSWIAREPAGEVSITGAGSYLVGGEFAVQQRMSLDLAVGGGPAQPFDSGLIVGGGEFPRITIRVRLHASPTCTDTVLTVQAVPAVVGIGDGSGSASLAPNPFTARAQVSFALHQAGPVRVLIHDLSGRAVRKLAGGEWFEIGSHTLGWDGRTDDGAESAAGLYFVLVSTRVREDVRGLVKLR